MLYTYDYNSEYTPSLPMVEIKIGKARAVPDLLLKAVVDSGADGTIIPIRWLRTLGARRSKKVWMRTPAAARILVDLYPISVQLAEYERNILLVVGGPDTEEAIIGRDVLNDLIVTLNGLAGVTEITR